MLTNNINPKIVQNTLGRLKDHCIKNEIISEILVRNPNFLLLSIMTLENDWLMRS